MDTSDPEIEFDERGICNHCRKYDELMQSNLFPAQERQRSLQDLVSRIKESGRKKKYDCLIGVSGGTDSTYTAYLVKNLGLRPLAVHLDNGWDSELAVSNIERTLKKLKIDLYTYIIDWEEFRDLQLAFLMASTPDCEIPTDHAIVAILSQVALRNNMQYIILGVNIATEAILPPRWSCGHGDWKYIKGIHKKFGKIKLRTFPHYNFIQWLFYFYMKYPEFINILDYINYNKKEAIKIIEEKLEWRNYGGKHCESIYTSFFQGYILPKKFRYDKRRAHLSALICSGQITREEALREIEKDQYPSEELKKEDKEYVIKKLRLSEEKFEEIMALPAKQFGDYPSYASSVAYKLLSFWWRKIKNIKRVIRNEKRESIYS